MSGGQITSYPCGASPSGNPNSCGGGGLSTPAPYPTSKDFYGKPGDQSGVCTPTIPNCQFVKLPTILAGGAGIKDFQVMLSAPFRQVMIAGIGSPAGIASISNFPILWLSFQRLGVSITSPTDALLYSGIVSAFPMVATNPAGLAYGRRWKFCNPFTSCFFTGAVQANDLDVTLIFTNEVDEFDDYFLSIQG